MKIKFLKQLIQLESPFDWNIITQPFGANYLSYYKKLGIKAHSGYDIRAEMETPIKAGCSGVVLGAGTARDGAKFVKIRSNKLSGFSRSLYLEVLYYHLNKVLIQKGYEIKKGTVIGLSGNTGHSSGPHLHIACRLLKKSLKIIDYNNGYKGYFDFDELMEDRGWKLTPVQKRYGRYYDKYNPKKRPFHAYLSEKKVAFNPWLIKRLKRLPNNDEIKALTYGGYPIEIVENPAMYPIWGSMKFSDYKAGKKPPIRLTIDSN